MKTENNFTQEKIKDLINNLPKIPIVIISPDIGDSNIFEFVDPTTDAKKYFMSLNVVKLFIEEDSNFINFIKNPELLK